MHLWLKLFCEIFYDPLNFQNNRMLQEVVMSDLPAYSTQSHATIFVSPSFLICSTIFVINHIKFPRVGTYWEFHQCRYMVNMLNGDFKIEICLKPTPNRIRATTWINDSHYIFKVHACYWPILFQAVSNYSDVYKFKPVFIVVNCFIGQQWFLKWPQKISGMKVIITFSNWLDNYSETGNYCLHLGSLYTICHVSASQNAIKWQCLSMFFSKTLII